MCFRGFSKSGCQGGYRRLQKRLGGNAQLVDRLGRMEAKAWGSGYDAPRPLHGQGHVTETLPRAGLGPSLH